MTFSNPAVVMLAAVSLYSLYPPLSNELLERQSAHSVGVLIHATAAIFMVALAICCNPLRHALKETLVLPSRTRFLTLALGSSIFIFISHGSLYFALQKATEREATSILLFETWPVLFFLIDAILSKNARSSLNVRDYLMVFATFGGFAVLMSQEFSSPIPTASREDLTEVIVLSILGALAMMANIFCRRATIRSLSPLVEGPSKVTMISAGFLSELFVRVFCALLFVGSFIFSGETVIDLTSSDFAILLVTSILAVAIGSIFHDIAYYRSQNATIAALWYLMPVGAIIALSVIQWRLPNKFEVFAGVLIVSANLLLALKPKGRLPYALVCLVFAVAVAHSTYSFGI